MLSPAQLVSLALLALAPACTCLSLEDLVCPTGSYRDTATFSCKQCPYHTFADSANQTSCTPCPPNTELPQYGGSSLSQCRACPANMASEQGAACTCPPPDMVVRSGACVAWAGLSKPATCDYITSYRDMVTGDCRLAKQRCETSQSQGCCSIGISVVHTKVADSVCYVGLTGCPVGYYRMTDLALDYNDVVLSEVRCRQVSSCLATQFEYQPPSETMDRVCIQKTNCSQGQFYEAFPASSTSDAVCKPRTQCDYARQYLNTSGGATADDTCGEMAYPCKVGHFLSSPAVNATPGGAVASSPGLCSPYTRCRPGSYISKRGTEESDVECSHCPAGERCAPPSRDHAVNRPGEPEVVGQYQPRARELEDPCSRPVAAMQPRIQASTDRGENKQDFRGSLCPKVCASAEQEHRLVHEARNDPQPCSSSVRCPVVQDVGPDGHHCPRLAREKQEGLQDRGPRPVEQEGRSR